ncbi:P-loop NTPase fold protein [Saccharibacillus endophyticus]|uniref:KAP NTPase domain-containing protein n=1 Tax=Saccharibacillus endophyticus TaxID=2060666 RepID=A0ABQ1ZR34_9BACL|nr:P-loop NTPase fold protein [Saccharibacillus endophyticus]GGH76461.1 hypothetical protein GCM10007362_18740 [Saccharibacillus endophyticus]
MSTNENHSKKQPDVRIGARDLKEQVYKIIPTYDLLLEQLKEIENSATYYSVYRNNEQNQKDRQDFNNTIGIFGPRGTGKSSVLYTLQAKLSERKTNILLPLIEPDNFGENTKIIGSIVGLLCEEGKSLLKALKKQQAFHEDPNPYFNNGILKPNNPLKQIIDETIEYHLYTERQYRDIIGQNYADFATHIRKSERVLIPDIEFKKKLMTLINTIIEVKHFLVKQEPCQDEKEGNKVQTDEAILIYIFIDDIDLKTSKTRELMDALMQYTNHPNIVTVLSGDYEILTESLTLALLKDEPLQQLGLTAISSLKRFKGKLEDLESEGVSNEAMTILERKTGLAHEYIKKIIPPARRHQLIKWNEKTIPNFAFGEVTLADQLAEALGEWSVFGYPVEEQEQKSPTIKANSRGYIIFDERPRGIVNAYYHLNQLVKTKNNKNKDVKKYFQLVKAFVDTLILSNNKLSLYQGFIYESFLIWGSDETNSVIKYEILNELETQTATTNDHYYLRMALYTIAELVTALLPQMTKDSNHYFGWRKQVMDNVLSEPETIQKLNEQEKNKEAIKEQYIVSNYLNRNQYAEYRLFFLLESLAVFSDPTIAAIFAESVVDFVRPEFYYRTRWDASDAQSKDENAIRAIHELLLKEKKLRKYKKDLKESVAFPERALIQELYYQAYYAQDLFRKSLANFSINLMESLCAETAESVKAERQFDLVMQVWNSKMSEFSYTDREKQKGNTNFGLQAKRTLFLNTIVELKKSPLVYAKFRETSAHAGKLLNTINAEISSKGSLLGLPESLFFMVESRMKKFSSDLIQKLFDQELFIDLSAMNKKESDDFLNAYSGVTYTRYDEAKAIYSQIANKEKVTFLSYYKALEKIESLAQNNRVYYGRTDANKFLPELRNGAKLSNAFSRQESFTIQQYSLYVQASESEVNIVAYEEAKEFISEELRFAQNTFQKKTAQYIQEYNILMNELDEDRLNQEEIQELKLSIDGINHKDF